MIYSIKDEHHKELTDNKLRNEIIYAFKTNQTSVDYKNETYLIEGAKAERVGYKQIHVKKD